MIEEGDEPVGEVPFARSYHTFKYMTGVSLLSLGGVFAFADGGGMTFDRKQLVVLLAFIAVAAVTSVLMVGQLAALEIKPEPREVVVRRIRAASVVVGMSLPAVSAASPTISWWRCSDRATRHAGRCGAAR